jgi:uncharacterized protein YlzI (FlbEa/FlbD family)
MATYKQKTFYVNDRKITIKSTPRTSLGNFVGYSVFINGKKYIVNTLYREEAENKAYARWVKENIA